MNTQEFIDKWTDRPGEQAVMARDIEAMVAALQVENTRLRAALKRIADGNPAPPEGKWLSDAKMAQIARRALSNQTKPKPITTGDRNNER